MCYFFPLKWLHTHCLPWPGLCCWWRTMPASCLVPAFTLVSFFSAKEKQIHQQYPLLVKDTWMRAHPGNTWEIYSIYLTLACISMLRMYIIGLEATCRPWFFSKRNRLWRQEGPATVYGKMTWGTAEWVESNQACYRLCLLSDQLKCTVLLFLSVSWVFSFL